MDNGQKQEYGTNYSRRKERVLQTKLNWKLRQAWCKHPIWKIRPFPELYGHTYKKSMNRWQWLKCQICPPGLFDYSTGEYACASSWRCHWSASKIDLLTISRSVNTSYYNAFILSHMWYHMICDTTWYVILRDMWYYVICDTTRYASEALVNEWREFEKSTWLVSTTQGTCSDHSAWW